LQGKNEHDNSFRIIFSEVQNRQFTGGFGFAGLNNVILHLDKPILCEKLPPAC